MIIRQLQNSDLKVTKGHFASKNRQRVHISIIGFSLANKTYWLTEEQQHDLKTVEQIKTDIHTLMTKRLRELEKFIIESKPS